MVAIVANAAMGAAQNAFIAGSGGLAATGFAAGSIASFGPMAAAAGPVGWAVAAGMLAKKFLPKLFGGGGTKKAVEAVGKEISSMRDEMNKRGAYDSAERQRQSWSMERAMANASGGRNRFAPRPTEPSPVVGGGLQDQYRTPQGDTNWEYMFRRMVSGNDQSIGL